MALDYAPLIHCDREDFGLTAALRFTKSDRKQPSAYNFVQPTLHSLDGRQGVIFVQNIGCLTLFRAKDISHTSTVNEAQPDPDWPTLGVVVLQKMRTLNGSERRSDVLEDMVNFDILNKYHARRVVAQHTPDVAPYL
jgi:hypothetical protein